MPRQTLLPRHPRDMVLTALRKSKKPVTAYGLLKLLKPRGVNSAPIIYRALADLEKAGSAHKVNALGAYVACDCTKQHTHALSVLTVCRSCEAVEELHDHAVIHQLQSLRKMAVNIAESAVIELPVMCSKCNVMPKAANQ